MTSCFSSPTIGRASRRFRSLVVGVAVMSSGTSALAQPVDKDKDLDAERLFREAQQLMGERRYGEACPKFDAAYHKDQQLGTLLNLAYCHKEQGATWLAWLEFKEAELKAVELKRNDRRDFARQRMAELEKQLGKVQVEPTTKVELTEVLVEDRHVPGAEKGQSFFVELGQRKFAFRATGKKPAVQMVTVGPTVKGGAPQRISVPEMEEQPKEEPVVVAPPPEPQPAPAAPAHSDGAKQRTTGLIVAGAGAVGILVGSVTGIMTFTNDCTTDRIPRCDEKTEKSELDRGKLTSTVSNVSFAVGGVLLAGGLLLYFLAPPNKSTASLPSNASSLATKKRDLRVYPEVGAGWVSLKGTF